ncbi:conserved Plasmodium protein, unknown function [Plasmodium relictum]|uniref:Uncharacterized protein n=1 Tax=Plasmodium relictum TaxID=85471 RepID=A0A1J1HBE3_PLARL|nr:conserved Plasmodium protein, unknown function [Plasmodium relictum]CRH02615.1 conserved Plasmodium protein, unknown function [Plasmodium relictum]
MNKKKSSKINVLNKKIEEKIREEKRDNNKISNEVMKLINKEIITDYCTNKKENAKLILNKYLNIIKYLMKENLNLKKIIETNKLENVRKNDIITNYENELRKKSDIIDSINKLGIDALKENIKICDNSKVHEGAMLILENDNSSKVKLENLIDSVQKNNSPINNENKENNYFISYYLNSNIEEKDKFIENTSFNYKNKNSKFTHKNEEKFINKCIRGEDHNSILKKDYPSENIFINNHKSIEKNNYNNKFHEIYKYDNFNKKKNLEKKKSLVFIKEGENEILKDKKLNPKQNKYFVENSLNFFISENNKLHDDDKCIDELNYLINNKSIIKNFENYSKKYEMEYKNGNTRNAFISDDLDNSSQFQNEKKIPDNSIENIEYFIETSRTNDDYVKIKSINIPEDVFEEKKEDINKNPQEILNKQIHDNSYYIKIKDGSNLYINSDNGINTNVINEATKNIVSKNINYVNKNIDKNNKLIENNNYGNYNKTNYSFSEEKNKSDLEDGNYEDLENIMSTILKFRKKN